MMVAPKDLARGAAMATYDHGATSIAIQQCSGGQVQRSHAHHEVCCHLHSAPRVLVAHVAMRRTASCCAALGMQHGTLAR